MYFCGLIGYLLEPLQPIPSIYQRWTNSLASPVFRKQALVYLLIFIAILIAFPHFFAFIESRQGWQLSDPLLGMIPAKDLSIFIYSTLWLMSLFLIVRMIQQPSLALLAIIAIDLILIILIGWLILEPIGG